jgi:ribose transport system permease protein
VRAFGDFMQRFGVVVAFVVLFGFTAVWEPEIFLKPENLRNLLNHNAPTGIIAVGMTLVIIAGGIDLSVGSLLALSAALGIVILNKLMGSGTGEAMAVAIASLSTVLIGGALGAFNGAMVVFGRVAPFVATLVGLVSYRSLCLAIAEGSEIRSESKEMFAELGTGGIPIPFITLSGDRPLVITWAMILFLVCALVAGFLLNWTKFGRYTIAVGANERAATYSAVPVARTKFSTYVVIGLFTGVAALTLSTRMNSVATANLGLYYELDAIAAVVIGGTSLRGGAGRIWATVVGVLLLGVITNMLVLAEVSVYWQGVVKGAIILAAVLLQRGRES